MPEHPGEELAFCLQRRASKSARVIGSSAPVKSTRSILVRMRESLLLTTGLPWKAYPSGNTAADSYGFQSSGGGNIFETWRRASASTSAASVTYIQSDWAVPSSAVDCCCFQKAPSTIIGPSVPNMRFMARWGRPARDSCVALATS